MRSTADPNADPERRSSADP